jgi:hypothetical protein
MTAAGGRVVEDADEQELREPRVLKKPILGLRMAL